MLLSISDSIVGHRRSNITTAAKTDAVITKDDVEVSERQRSSITMIKAVNTVKEAIEEQKVNKGETVEEVGEWGEKIEQVTTEADGNV